MQNSITKLVRPLNFQHDLTNAPLHQFVHGNHSQVNSLYAPTLPLQTAPSFYPQTSFFDRYNRNNLLLRDCDQRDIIPLLKNIVIHQDQLSQGLIDEITAKSQKQKIKTQKLPQYQQSNHKKQNNFIKTATAAPPSREYVQNEIMFNYKQMGQIKRKQKRQYLSEIEKKILMAQKQIQDLNLIQEQQKLQMYEINRFQAHIGQQLTKNVQTGLLQQKVGNAIGLAQIQDKEPIHIHQQMNPRQIAQILDQHYKLNQDILQIAEMAKYGKQKSVDKVPAKSKQLSNTLKKGLGGQKSMFSTMKDGAKNMKKLKK